MSMQTPLAKAKGQGTSGEGSHHWWLQRVSALALVPLTLWFMVAIIQRLDSSYAELTAWVAEPINALGLLVYLGFMFFHAHLGLQIVIEDYIHSTARRVLVRLVVSAVLLLAWVAAVFAVLRIAL